MIGFVQADIKQQKGNVEDQLELKNVAIKELASGYYQTTS